jgi:hypothetical protein
MKVFCKRKNNSGSTGKKQRCVFLIGHSQNFSDWLQSLKQNLTNCVIITLQHSKKNYISQRKLCETKGLISLKW